MKTYSDKGGMAVVWNYEQSTREFYNRIDSINGKDTAHFDEKPPAPPPCPPPHEEEPIYRKGNFKEPPKTCKCGHCHSFPPCSPPAVRRKDFLSDIFSDPDKLLIAGLMLLLIREKSSMYVILALAYVLFT